MGVVSCESLFHTVTSGLQSVAVSYYENRTVRITCSFVSGSLSPGCLVSMSLNGSSATIIIEITRYIQSYYLHIILFFYFKEYRSSGGCAIPFH